MPWQGCLALAKVRPLLLPWAGRDSIIYQLRGMDLGEKHQLTIPAFLLMNITSRAGLICELLQDDGKPG